MRVLLSTNSRDRGSTSRTLETWTRLLPSFGIEPVVTVGGSGPLLAALRAAGIATSIRPLRVIPEKRWPLPFVAAVASLATKIRLAGAGLVHVNEHDSHVLVSRAAWLARVPIITHMRFRPEADYCRWLFRPPYTPQRLLFTSATQMRDSAAAVEPVVPRDRWGLLPNGLDLETFGQDVDARYRLRAEWSIPDGTIVLGTACAISPRKRVDHFLRLIARLHAEGIAVRGFVAGTAHFPEDEALVERLRRLAFDLGIGDRVTFLGYVEPSEPLYHAWDICVSTSSYETFGMTVLEAMACRCATVAYPGGSVAEVAGEAARVVPDADEEALFAACRDLCRNASHRRDLGEAGRNRVASSYEMRRIVTSLTEEYLDVLTARRGRTPNENHRSVAGRQEI